MNPDAVAKPVTREPNSVWLTALRRVAWVSAVFSVLVAALLVANALYSKALDPVTPAKLDEMQAALNRDRTNPTLLRDLRSLDIEIRSRYFRSRAFAIDGLWLLLGGVIVYLLAIEMANARQRHLPNPNSGAPLAAWGHNPQGQRSVATLGLLLGGFLAATAVFSRHDAEAEYAKAAERGPTDAAVGSGSVPGGATTAPGLQTIQPGGPPPLSGSVQGPNAPSGGSLRNSGTSLVPINPPGPPGAKNGARAQPASASIKALFPEAWSAAWPGFRGPGGVGLAAAKDLPATWSPSKNVLWKAPIPLPGWNSPIVWGDRVFVSGATKDSRKVFAYDANTGALVWQQDAPSSTKEAPQVQEDTGYAPSTLATDGRRVFAMFPNGDLFCFDFQGKLLWRRDLGMPENVYGHASSPILYGNGLLVQLDQGTSPDDGKSKLMALGVDKGNTVWEVKRPVGGSWTTPILIKVGSEEQLVTAANPLAIAYNPANGQEIWRAQCLAGDCAPSPTFGDGYVFVANMGANLSAIRPDLKGDITKTGVGWTVMEDLPDIVSLMCTGDLLYMVTSEGVATCLDARTGKKQWSHNYNTRFHASPLGAAGKVYLTEDSGKTYMLAGGREYKEIGTGSIGEDVRATPAVVGRRIYVRGKANLWCLEAK